MISVNYNENEPYILMADDDEDDSLFMIAAFKEVGLFGSIKRINNGSDLLVRLDELLSNNAKLPSVIILDLNMPKTDGKTVLKSIKANANLKDIPVIIYSTSSTKADMLESYELGCNGYIVKPGNYNEIEKIAEKIKNFFIDTINNKSDLAKKNLC